VVYVTAGLDAPVPEEQIVCQLRTPRAFAEAHVRQLENAIKRYLILPDLEMAFAELKSPNSPAQPLPQDNLSLKDVAAQAAELAERELVLRVLEDTNWNRKQSARRLGICYKALLNKLKKWQVDNRPRANGALAKAA